MEKKERKHIIKWIKMARMLFEVLDLHWNFKWKKKKQQEFWVAQEI